MKQIECIKVLLIEDNKTVQFAVRRLLSESSYWQFTIDTSVLLGKGLEMVKSGNYDVVLADLELPDSIMSETMASLKKQLTDIPFVILTAEDDDELLLQSVEAGAQDYLCKDHIMHGPLLSRSLYYAVQHWRLKNRLEYMASHDELTNVLNKRYFFMELEKRIKSTEDHRDGFCLSVCDLDNFRAINNNFGHMQGDKALVSFVDAIRGKIRDTDIVGRFGGDEFCILFDNTGKEECTEILAGLASIRIQEPKEISGSFGGAEYRRGMTRKQLISLADEALYKVKKSGKGFSIIL